MPDSDWEVMVPTSVHPSGPEAMAEFATITRFDERRDAVALDVDLARFDAVIARVQDVSESFLRDATALKVIAKHGAGLDNVDVAAATGHDVAVCNTPDANARSVAEHAVMLVLAVRMETLAADRHLRGGGWDRNRFANRDVAGDVVGLLGFGNVAERVVERLRGFGVSFVAYDPYVPSSAFPEDVSEVTTLGALFERADVVSVHVPLTEETRHAVSSAELEKLGPDGTLVNTARGDVVDQTALLAALREDAMAGAGLDVFEREPPPADDPLLERDDVLLTPHVAGVTADALEQMSRRAAENVRTVYEEEIPDSTVNEAGLRSDR